MSLLQLLSLSVAAILSENLVLVRFLGVSPRSGDSADTGGAAGRGLVLTLLMGAASALTWALDRLVLLPLRLSAVRTPVFVLAVVALAALADRFLRKTAAGRRAADLPLLAVNSAVLGVALLNSDGGRTFAESLLYGVCAGLGFTLAAVLLESLRERVEFSDCPACFRGFPIELVTAALLSMAFMGFAGLRIG